MIDIHHHLLYGIDDGPGDLASSLALADAAVADGITHIVCTPHANEVFEFSPETNQERLAAVRKGIGDKLTLGLGCDFHLSSDNIADALRHPTKYTINQGRYLLVEFAEFMIPRDIDHAFYELSLRGIRTIITHPERNPILQREPHRLTDWLRLGCLVQVTAASLSDGFGRKAQAVVWEMLEHDWVHFIATDAHNLNGRKPCLSGAHQAVAKRMDRFTADRLCIENPRAAFDNRDLGPQPTPYGLDEEDQPKRKGFMARMFGH
jgi:protein-tyrosine phosphatase